MTCLGMPNMVGNPGREGCYIEVLVLHNTVKHRRQGASLALADHNHQLALAVLVPGEATVPAVLFVVGRLHISTEISTIRLDDFARSGRV